MRVRGESGSAPAVLAPHLCIEEALRPWCRALPATFGADAAMAADERKREGRGTMTDAILAGAVLAAMAALAVHDARRALVDPRLVLALLGAAAAWRFGGGGPEADGTWPRLASGVLGASLGVAAVMIPIALAAWLRAALAALSGRRDAAGGRGVPAGAARPRLGHGWAQARG